MKQCPVCGNGKGRLSKLIIILLMLGMLALGFLPGLIIGYKEGEANTLKLINPTYEREIHRLSEWNKLMTQTMINMIGKR